MLKNERWFSTGEVAAYLAIHPNTVKRWAKTGYLPGSRWGTRGDWRFEKAKVDAWLAARATAPRAGGSTRTR